MRGIRTFTQSRWVTGRRRHFVAVLGVVLALMAAVNLLDHFGPALASLVLGPSVGAALLVLARHWGLSWDDLGLARHSWRRGAVIALGSIVLVALGYATAAALPVTRLAFLDARYQLPVGRALFTALVVIPMGTVVVEEIAFRGVLMGLLTRRRSGRWGLGVSSALFGLWHVLPSLGLNRVNRAVAQVAGSGDVGRLVIVAGVVTFTALSGVLLGELRRRSGSLLASAGLHWAVNGVGVLVAATLVAVRAV
ncbi:MAG TPA: CPBP family intramembrane glutamic endopeptidase [Kineosporiaceae bacterium]